MSTPLSKRVAALAPSIIRVMNGRRRPTSIDLSLGQPALPPDPGLVKEALEATEKAGWGYTPNPGIVELREVIAKHHGLPGRDQPQNVIVTVGSEEAVYLALLSSVDPGDEILFPEPGYPAYRGIAGLIGATPVPYPIDRATGLVARADAIEARITERTRIVVLNSPSNPFGTFEDEAELARIAKVCEAHGVTILADEIYRDLVYGDRVFRSITEITDRAILVSGLSKSCALTGFRLGYLVADADFVVQATLAHQLVVTCTARISQHAAVRVFAEPEHLVRHVPYYADARAAVAEAAKALPEDVPLFLGEGAFYAIIDVSRRTDDAYALAVRLLEEEDVVVVPGVAFGPGGEWFWRLSYAAGAETASEGVRRIARFLG